MSKRSSKRWASEVEYIYIYMCILILLYFSTSKTCSKRRSWVVQYAYFNIFLWSRTPWWIPESGTPEAIWKWWRSQHGQAVAARRFIDYSEPDASPIHDTRQPKRQQQSLIVLDFLCPLNEIFNGDWKSLPRIMNHWCCRWCTWIGTCCKSETEKKRA